MPKICGNTTKEGTESPLFYCRKYSSKSFIYMISKEQVRKLIEEKIENTPIFIVDVKVGGGNKIMGFVDTPEGVTIEECIQISRHIEASLDREVEDYELEISSPGLDQSLKVHQQYTKNVGRDVQVTSKDGKVTKGTILSADDNTFTVESSSKVKVEGKKNKQLVVEQAVFNYKEIKETKIIISFK